MYGFDFVSYGVFDDVELRSVKFASNKSVRSGLDVLGGDALWLVEVFFVVAKSIFESFDLCRSFVGCQGFIGFEFCKFGLVLFQIFIVFLFDVFQVLFSLSSGSWYSSLSIPSFFESSGKMAVVYALSVL